MSPPVSSPRPRPLSIEGKPSAGGGRLRPLVSVGVLAIAFALAAGGCAKSVKRTLVKPEEIQTLNRESPYLKVHMKNGDLYVLQLWSVDSAAAAVRGVGDHFGPDRDGFKSGEQVVPIDQVALFETNVKETSPAIASLAVITVLSGALTVACLSNPKACFGSCPTFYVFDGESDHLHAEGFSESIAPSLEATDIDALYRARPTSRALTLRMTNEALETHMVRRADVIAVERPLGGRVAVDAAGTFHALTRLTAPSACTGEEGSCLGAVAAVDGEERWSRTDGKDLAAKEFVELRFPLEPTPGAHYGVLIEARQTFLSTFLLYQALAFLGRQAGAFFAAMERGQIDLAKQAKGLHSLLGGIELQVMGPDGDWRTIGTYEETGPLATDVEVFGAGSHAPQAVRLVMTRGHWRLGHVAVAELSAAAAPIVLVPTAVDRIAGTEIDPYAALSNDERTLVTMPGDEYTIHYELPGDPGRYELFLQSRGYYLEWMREEWMADENPAMAALLMAAPSLALRLLAPKFKKMEPKMEEIFWKSRYAR